MKKNLVKKTVLPVFVALLCSVIALTSVSYAWFSLGNTASVTGMEMKVSAADGLQISATGNAAEFKSNLVLNDLKYEGNNNNFPAADKASDPVSTDGKYEAGTMKFFTGTIGENGRLSDVQAAQTKDYIYFDFYVKVSSNTTLQLNVDSIVTIKDSQLQTHLAARVAFVDLGSALKAVDAQRLGATAEAVKIWEPNALLRSGAAENAGHDANVKLEYEGLNGTDPERNKAAVTTFAPIQGDNLKTTAVADLFDLAQGYNKIRVYIWLEGQDVDCVNEVSGGTFTITLNFIKKQAQNPQA